MRAQMAAVTGGLAPDDYIQAWWDWYLNLAKAPSKQSELAESAFKAFTDHWNFASQALTGQRVAPSSTDARFAGEAWSQWPFNVLARGYLNWEQLVRQSTSHVPGLSGRNADLVRFSSQQLLEAASPSNSLLSNPELLELTRAESGQNLIKGFKNWLEDADALLNRKPGTGGAEFRVGENLAITPGKVVYRNKLIELIQYTPTTPHVHAEPILIVPAWIMKFYILDLSPRNSLVRYLVEKGHTVFMVSWKNPNEADRELGMDDYLDLGIRDAISTVRAIVPDTRIHAVGYCIGGTLLSIAAADLARRGDQAFASMTLLAAQTDFSSPGELSLFISPSQLDMLEAVMNKAGVLTSEQMGASFMMLRSRDLLWNPVVNTYLKGERQKLNDLMAWNSDGTRMPCRMHSEYLRQLYLNNDLAAGRYKVHGETVELSGITLPMFVLGTEADHVAPWKSVYKARGLTRSSDFTFVLTSAGHNGGIVCGPENPKRQFRQLVWHDADTQLSPEVWLEQAAMQQGSWWPSWQAWLAAHSGPQKVEPPQAGNHPSLGDAPGSYVLQR
jgi:polyhydroxyalkanoate synthase